MFDKSNVDYVLDNIIPKLKHENDGLIFTREDKPYINGTCEYIVKWKPRRLNSVDFELVVKWLAVDDINKTQMEKYAQLRVSNNGVSEDYTTIYLDDQEQEKFLKEYKGRPVIAECVWDDDWYSIEIPSKEEIKNANWKACVLKKIGKYIFLYIYIN